MVVKSTARPQRRCIACRQEGDKNRFLRFVLSPDVTVIPDIEGKLPGRGAYTCLSRRCLLDAVARRQFGRAFKREITVNSAELDEMITTIMEQRICGYISLTAKAGVAASGGEMIERSLKNARPPYLLILSADISANMKEKICGMAARASVHVEQLLTKEKLGQLIGKESDRSAVAVMSDGFAKSLVKEIERYRNYLEEEIGR